MVEAGCELHEIETMTLKGLDESHQALDQLKADCRNAAESVVRDLAAGAIQVIDTAQWIHDFLVFEQEIVDLFAVDSTAVSVGSDTLKQAEIDMEELLKSFDAGLASMDVVGVSELLGGPVPALLTRFQDLLVVLRAQIHDSSNG